MTFCVGLLAGVSQGSASIHGHPAPGLLDELLEQLRCRRSHRGKGRKDLERHNRRWGDGVIVSGQTPGSPALAEMKMSGQ